jgi:prepilin peptidase CpaA
MILAQAAVLGLVTLAAAVYDWRERRIPNWLCLVCLGAAFVFNLFQADWRSGLMGFALALLIHVPLYLLRATGGGDLKLMAALGALLGPDAWLELFVISSLLGGVLAIAVILSRGVAGQVMRRMGKAIGELVRGRAPFGAAPELDIAHPQALTFPRGVVIALAAGLWIAWRVA